MKRRTPITQYCHERIQQMIKEPLLCIDATAGTGKDTVFLAKLVGEKGRVISMDIQEMAIEQTKKRLLKERLSDRAEVVLDSHAHMDKYAQKDSVSLIMFNLGYLPGGDHSLSTKADTTIEALGDSGFEEKKQVLAWLRELPDDKYTVLVEAFYNKPNNPPLPVYILKNETA